jgi:predicted RNA binding protein YcfA (HicA-like mRNA interferase family)/predicted RNase H-like HicB family nuclease
MDSVQPETLQLVLEGGPPSNYSAWSPSLPGCVATGETINQCVQEMRQAVKSHLPLIDPDSRIRAKVSGFGPGRVVGKAQASAMSVPDVIERLEQDGWHLERRKGSRCHYHHPTRRGYITIAARPSDTLHPRAAESVLSQAGLCGAPRT